MKSIIKNNYVFIIAFILFVFFTLSPSDTHAQCAMCKAAAESDLENNPTSIARGLNKGILFLMAIPYVILLVIFRNEVKQLFQLIKGKSKEPLNKNRLQWLSFGLSFISIMIILFIIFYNVMYQ